MHKGSCECGAVAFELSGELRPPIACHCTQCRKTSGHYWAATQVDTENLKITKDDGLKWFRSSDWARRGFCMECGSSVGSVWNVGHRCSGRWTARAAHLLGPVRWMVTRVCKRRSISAWRIRAIIIRWRMACRSWISGDAGAVLCL